MTANASDHQLGDFIKGRLLFIEDYCLKKKLDYVKNLDAIEAETLRLAGSEERREFIRTKLFGGSVLSSAFLPDWLDRVFLEAMTHVLKGPGAPVHTRSSRIPCIPFEAGRFNARRQAETVFRILFERKKPDEWLRSTFPVIYKKCYGEAAGANLRVEESAPGRVRVIMDNRTLEKASPMDCSSAVGYMFGSLEKLGASDILVTHPQCGAGQGEKGLLCLFELSWK